MKLALKRREAREGIFIKSTVYCLDVNIEATPEEMALLRKGWDRPLCGGLFRGDSGMRWNASEVVGKPTSWGFDKVTDRAHIEDQLVKNTKSLEKQLAEVAASAAGPREGEL